MAEGTQQLETEILKAVSRSFYLTLRLLPAGMRAPVSLGYLLARLSDTIADAGELALSRRRTLLERYREAVCVPGVSVAGDLARELGGAGLSAGEAELVRRAGECLRWLASLDAGLAAPIRAVVETITSGQLWDLERFAEEGVVRLEADEELDHYTYQVAGCVGEFWTEIGFLSDEAFSSESRDQLRNWGVQYGKGLQLINVLRDLPEDLERGRCYLPGEGALDLAALPALTAPWCERARAGLAAGRLYAGTLRGKRLRVATGLPALLGEGTLDLLEGASWDELCRGVKIPRRQVWGALGSAWIRSVPRLPGRW